MYEIMLLNAEFRQVLNENGELHVQGKKEFRPKYDTLEDAIIEKDKLLNKYIYAGVIIKTLETDGVVQEYYNEDLWPKYIYEKQVFYRWTHLPFYKRIFTKKPVFKYYDGKH